MRFRPALSTAIAAMVLTSCSTSMTRSPELVSAPLVTASCPVLTPLAGDSFGDTTRKLLEVVEQYYACREAALSVR